jgi:hypothetical protein
MKKKYECRGGIVLIRKITSMSVYHQSFIIITFVFVYLKNHLIFLSLILTEKSLIYSFSHFITYYIQSANFFIGNFFANERKHP